MEMQKYYCKCREKKTTKYVMQKLSAGVMACLIGSALVFGNVVPSYAVTKWSDTDYMAALGKTDKDADKVRNDVMSIQRIFDEGTKTISWEITFNKKKQQWNFPYLYLYLPAEVEYNENTVISINKNDSLLEKVKIGEFNGTEGRNFYNVFPREANGDVSKKFDSEWSTSVGKTFKNSVDSAELNWWKHQGKMGKLLRYHYNSTISKYTWNFETKVKDGSDPYEIVLIAGMEGNAGLFPRFMALGPHDSDGDGFSDRKEKELYGTDPNKLDSYPTIHQVYNLSWKQANVREEDKDLGFAWSNDGKTLIYKYAVNEGIDFNSETLLEQLKATGKANKYERVLDGTEKAKIMSNKDLYSYEQKPNYPYPKNVERAYLTDANTAYKVIRFLDVVNPSNGEGNQNITVQHTASEPAIADKIAIEAKNGADAFDIMHVVDGQSKLAKVEPIHLQVYARDNKAKNSIQKDSSYSSITQDVINLFVVGVDVTAPQIEEGKTKGNFDTSKEFKLDEVDTVFSADKIIATDNYSKEDKLKKNYQFLNEDEEEVSKENLEKNMTYTVKVLVSDEAGNKTELELGKFNSETIQNPPAPTEHNITVEDDGNGTGNANPAKAVKGTEVTLTANPKDGYKLKEWEIISPVNGVTITGNSFTMPDEDVTVRAIFEEDAPQPPVQTEHNITVEDDGNGTGSANPAKAVKGTEVTLTANPNDGYHFKEWENASQTNGLTIVNNKFIMPDEAVTVRAIFEKNSSSGSNSGSSKDKDKDKKKPYVSPIVKKPIEIQEVGVRKAYIFGYKDGTVKPNGNITRAEAAAMVARLKEYSLIYENQPKFKDTPSGWYNKYINAVVDANIMFGYPDGRFVPNGFITRGEFAQMIKGLDHESFDIAPFSDVKGHWAEGAINQAFGNNRIKGYEDGSFRPNAFITRGEATTILNNLFDRKVRQECLDTLKNPEKMKRFADLSKSYWGYYNILGAANTYSYGKIQEDDMWISIIDAENE